MDAVIGAVACTLHVGMLLCAVERREVNDRRRLGVVSCRRHCADAAAQPAARVTTTNVAPTAAK